MEPNSWASSDQQEDVEDLLANIVALRGHLKKTEKTLQDLGEQLYSNNSHNSELGVHELEILTLEDLADTSELQNYTVSKMSRHNSDSSRKSRSKSYSLAFDKSMEEENELLRDKLNVVRENNASLISQNHKLMNEIETIKFELNQSRAQAIEPRSSTLLTWNSISNVASFFMDWKKHSLRPAGNVKVKSLSREATKPQTPGGGSSSSNGTETSQRCPLAVLILKSSANGGKEESGNCKPQIATRATSNQGESQHVSSGRAELRR
ncbi:coiled-coil domain-containing protein 18-like [Thamnophis elegans]|uniref:coiled-coil domain-containing protein 18-like n=1 Tax=Thamnophis elegans TaxID=35005 RepID=UPI00137805EC|nr:coiled-coil domain-containing protein 18-like [Thamnophis elegans]